MRGSYHERQGPAKLVRPMRKRWLVFKSIRGLDRPWLVFSPEERLTAPRENWHRGFSTFNDAMEYVRIRTGR